MRAALYYKARDLRVEEVTKPAAAAGEALIKVIRAGLCGSDQHRYTGEREVSYLPMILGHEYFGCIEDLGEGAEGFNIGDFVVGKPYTPCGKCRLCLTGQSNICRSRVTIGQQRPGCFAQYISVPVSTLYRVDSDVKPNDAVMAEPTGIALRTIQKAGSIIGKRVAIIGAGAMGLLTLKTCVQAGALCYSCDIVPEKLELAKQFGAVHTFNSIETNPVEKMMELTDGFGPDVVIETAGITKTLEQAIEMASYGGRVVSLGLSVNKAMISPILIAQKELTIVGSLYYVEEFGMGVDLINAGKMDFTGLISHVLPLDEIRAGFEMLIEGREAVKILIDMEK